MATNTSLHHDLVSQVPADSDKSRCFHWARMCYGFIASELGQLSPSLIVEMIRRVQGLDEEHGFEMTEELEVIQKALAASASNGLQILGQQPNSHRSACEKCDQGGCPKSRRARERAAA